MSETKIFVRERRKAKEKGKEPRFNVVAVAGLDLRINSKHLRKMELEEIARAVQAELVYLQDRKDGSGNPGENEEDYDDDDDS